MKKLNLFLTLVALSLATTTLWAKPAAADANGKLPGAFTINSNCDMVYFSQGNLQYIGSAETPYWKFAEEQYEYFGTTTGQNSSATDVDRDLLGWGTSGYHDPTDTYNTRYQPWNTEDSNVNTEYNYKGYGPSLDKLPENHSWSEYEATKNYDWGVYNPISNGGNQAGLWRTLTLEEWQWIIGVGASGILYPTSNKCRYTYNTINGTQYARFTRAKVNGTFGLIIFPDVYTGGTPSGVTWGRINVYDNTSNYTTCTTAGWLALEAAGCVFLVGVGRRDGTNYILTPSRYYCSTQGSSILASGVMNREDSYSTVSNSIAYRSDGGYVRLVQDVPDDVALDLRPQASVATPPTAVSGLVYNGSPKALVNAAGAATGGTVKYKLSTQGEGDWSTTRPSVTNAGEYIVQWFVDASGCYVDSEVEEIHVTIARRTASNPSPRPTVAAASSLTYNGSSQNLVTATGDLQEGYKLVYSTDGTTWSDEIPKGTNAGDYTGYYKFYKGDNEEYVPSSNTFNVTIAKADLPGVTLPEATSTIPYEGTPQTLLEIAPVANATISYKLGSGEWTTTPPTATAAADYSVQYQIVPDDAVNYNTIGPNTVTVTIKDYPTVTDQSVDNDAIMDILTNLEDPWKLKIQRTIYADGDYNTICLPFDVTASDFADDTYPLYGYERLKAFKGASVTGEGQALHIDIFVEDVDHMDAGVPYLITYPADRIGGHIVNPVFQLSSTTTYAESASAVSANGVTFQGMFAQEHIAPYQDTREQDFLFLGANNELYWPEVGDASYMRGFRAYFIINRSVISVAHAPRGTRARIMDAPKTTTGIDELNTTICTKFIENGQLYIIKNGVKYNAQGIIVK